MSILTTSAFALKENKTSKNNIKYCILIIFLITKILYLRRLTRLNPTNAEPNKTADAGKGTGVTFTVGSGIITRVVCRPPFSDLLVD